MLRGGQVAQAAAECRPLREDFLKNYLDFFILADHHAWISGLAFAGAHSQRSDLRIGAGQRPILSFFLAIFEEN
jgi:hypothetical protein